ncbi:MAG: DUF1848 domain-containing protein [Bacteroidales bacterium]|nr:DUF1848 domain-containing protein [Bacteroidales bacterium]
MGFKGWPEITVKRDNGEKIMAKAPIIVSASRSTDIPAFYSKWFFHRLKKGHLKWINPFNGKPQYISFQNTRVIVFWSKNPLPIIPYLPILEEKGIHYYFLFTLNDYKRENLEPNVPQLQNRLNTFMKLSRTIGKEKVIWRYDPLLLTPNMEMDQLLTRIQHIGDTIHPFTEKLVISFVQINRYSKVKAKLMNESNLFNKDNLLESEFSKDQKIEFAKKLRQLNKRWKLQLAKCAGDINLASYGILPNKCIDDNLMKRLFSNDTSLMYFLHTGQWSSKDPKHLFENFSGNNPSLKDKGQRSTCRCIYSKDIGMYNTCPHICLYCYANTSAQKVNYNISQHNSSNEGII